MTAIERETTLRRNLGFVGIGFVLMACEATSVPNPLPTSGSAATPAASSSPTSPSVATAVRIEFDQIIATSEATTLGLHHDYTETGRSALTFVVRSGRNAEFDALDGFVDGQLAGFSGEAGALISSALAFDTGEHAQTALDLFLDELRSPDGYAFGAGEPAGVGDAGVCDRGPNRHLDGLLESICVWRNAALVLIAGGPMGTADVRAIAASMDARANRLAATAAEPFRGPDVDWSALPPVAQAYGKAWNERDDSSRLRLLEQAWAETGEYADPTMDGRVVGRQALADMIGQFMAPGEYFEPRGWIASDEHHGYVQMAWHFCSSEGLRFSGVDFGELGLDGRLQRVTGFFALSPEQPRAVCAPPAGDWTGIPEIARKWGAAAGADPATRSALIREVFAEGATYVDPSDAAPVVGHVNLDERVAGMLWDGAFFEAAAWADGDDHHQYMRLRWRLCDKDAPGLEGTDFVELDGAGRFLRVIGFFPWP